MAALIDYWRRTPQTVDKPDWRNTWAAASYAPPEIWVHGNGRGAVECALEHGLALGLSILHHNANPDPALAHEYRHRFAPRGGREKPLLALAVSGICAPTTAQAQTLYASHDYRDVRANILGDPPRWQDELALVQERYQPDVIVVLDLCQHYADRLASYTLLAESFGLTQPASF